MREPHWRPFASRWAGLALGLGVLSAGLVVSGCETSPPAAPGSGNPPAAPAVPLTPRPTGVVQASPERLVLADSAVHLQGPSLATLKLSAVRDLWVRAVVRSAVDPISLHASFFTPAGDLFYERRFPFSLGGKKKLMRAPAGHEVDLLPTSLVPDGIALDAMIPIAGSNFDRYAIAGGWIVQVEVEQGGKVTTQLSQSLEFDVSQ